jgi:ABC-type phosphate/phosphonate transport system substrate-binding protein
MPGISGRYRPVLVLILGLMFCLRGFAADAVKPATMIRFGVSPWFSTNVNFQRNMIEPIVTALQTDSGIGVKYESALDNIQFVRGAMDGRYDLVFVPAHVAALLVADCGFKPVLGYHLPTDFAVYVLKQSSASTAGLESLKGKRVGLPDEFGLTTEVAMELFQKQGLVPGNIDIHYEKYDQLVLKLFRGDIDAIVTNPLVITFLEPRMQERIQPVFRSPDANLKLTHVYLIAPKVPPTMVASLRGGLARFYQSPETRQKLSLDRRYEVFANPAESDFEPALRYADRLRQRLKAGVALDGRSASQ